MLALSIWPLGQWRLALPTIEKLPGVSVVLHSTPEGLEQHAVPAAQAYRSAGVDKVYVGVAIDERFTATAAALGRVNSSPDKVVADLQKYRLKAVTVALQVGAEAVIWDAEGAWKHKIRGFDSAAAASLIEATSAKCPLRQYYTAFDQPTLHSAYPWNTWDSIESLPQVYAAPGNELPAIPRMGVARLGAHQRSWSLARLRTPGGVYVQGHHVTVMDTCWIANTFTQVFVWTAPKLVDSEGLKACKALLAIDRAGFHGVGRIQAFQKSRGLVQDGLVGPATLRALG